MTTGNLPFAPWLSRRELMRWLSWSAAGLMATSVLPRLISATPAPRCVVRPQQTEGPYFVDELLNRSDIRSDPTNGEVKQGTALALTLAVSRLSGGECRRLAGAQVDIWHCDALGIYSDVADPHFNTVGQKFLRGYQMTDGKGEARFLTIYPGWYPGRTVHIHVKIRTAHHTPRGLEFTTQMYFDDALSNEVHGQPPYAIKGKRPGGNQDDRIFQRGGEHLVLVPQRTDGGYAATFAMGLQFP